ncbi:hypothetical protein OUZ56_000110 [Daphnia magna]|uniref:Uncharacterized protein n=1 Tax=Daphnia magna TaxID=35525 RepID=A0ABQ9ZYZ0_9CRUS|nr:hypothetical protein OUZ56_000110 [Daphnia magna]
MDAIRKRASSWVECNTCQNSYFSTPYRALRLAASTRIVAVCVFSIAIPLSPVAKAGGLMGS